MFVNICFILMCPYVGARKRLLREVFGSFQRHLHFLMSSQMFNC